MQKGFIQIPILIAIIVGAALVGGGVFVVKEISKEPSVAINEEQAEASTPELTETPSPMPGPTENPNPTPEPTEEEEVEESPTPEPTPEPISEPEQKPTPEELSDKYATIIRLTDSKGNTNPQSSYNEQEPTWFQPWPELKVGETITINVDVANQIADPVVYQFVGTGFPNKWQEENSVTVTIDGDVFNVETIHLRVFVKNSDEQYRAPYYDDMIQVFYIKK